MIAPSWAKRALIVAGTTLLIGAAAPAEPISLSIRAWGQRVAEWRIEPDGAIVSTVMDPATPGASSTYTLVTRRVAAAPGRYESIATMLKPVRRYAGKTLPCRNPMTDQDSGALQWGTAATFNYYSGCNGNPTRALVQRVYAANQQITIWTKDAPISGRRVVGPGQ